MGYFIIYRFLKNIYNYSVYKNYILANYYIESLYIVKLFVNNIIILIKKGEVNL